MQSSQPLPGRHRLGMENGVHCILIPEVAAALAAHRRNWFTMLLTNARHSEAASGRFGQAKSVTGNGAQNGPRLPPCIPSLRSLAQLPTW